jgi:SAM-dependent methyltransferase
MMGININDKCQDFTGQILRGEKTIETRKTRSLDPYIGERVGLIRTGVGKATLVGYATVGEPVVYDSVAKFRRDSDKHLVAPGSAFDIKDDLKYGYPLMQVEAITPKQVQSKGIVARRLNPATRQTETPEFKRWFGESVVVDADGDPLVAYHGTSKDKPFSSFTRNAQGTWFTSDPESASSYAMTNDSQKVVYEDGRYVSKNTSSHVIPVYLSIKNPLKVEGELLEKWRRSVNYRAANKLMVSQAKYTGHDGLVFPGGVFVAFEPTQIKSSIGNRGTFDPEDSNITNPYTRPDLRDRLKRKIMAGSKGGNPGQWSARKAQLLAAEYEKAGGGYSGKRTASQRSLSKWTKQDWRTKSGKPSLETGERYLPAAAITALTSAEYAETSRAKRKATGQFSRQPKRIAMKTSEYRNPKDPRSAMTQITGTEDTYINASKMLGGKVLDYGAGRGIGTDALRSNGLLADSFEPFPQNWEGKRPPTFTDSADIPSESYDSLVSFSVINVVDPDERKFLFKEVARILRPDGVALITGRDRQDVSKATTKIPHLEEGGYLIGKGKLQRYQKGFTQAELERYAKEVLGPGFTVEANRALNGASIKITKGKPNPAKRNTVRSKLSQIIEPGDRMVCYDTASGEDFYRLWDIVHTALPLTEEALTEIEGMLDDDGVLVIESGETPAGLQDHFRKATRYNGLLLVQGPKDPEGARIKTEELRRELE